LKTPGKCNDFGDNPACLGEPDPKYTMDFSGIGEPPILWCSHCGVEANMINEALRGPEFMEEFAKAVNEAANERRSRSH
jgi:hypothetical protein